MYKANIVQLVKNISTCTKNINKFPLNTNFAHQQMVVTNPKAQQKLDLSSVDNLQVIVSSNKVVKATP